MCFAWIYYYWVNFLLWIHFSNEYLTFGMRCNKSSKNVNNLNMYINNKNNMEISLWLCVFWLVNMCCVLCMGMIKLEFWEWIVQHLTWISYPNSACSNISTNANEIGGSTVKSLHRLRNVNSCLKLWKSWFFLLFSNQESMFFGVFSRIFNFICDCFSWTVFMFILNQLPIVKK